MENTDEIFDTQGNAGERGLENSSEYDIQSNISTINTEPKHSLTSLPSEHAHESLENENEFASENGSVKDEENLNKTELVEDVLNASGDHCTTNDTEEKEDTIPEVKIDTAEAEEEVETAPLVKKSQPKRDVCLVCEKTVYPLEKRMLDGKIYHNNCVRCKKCNKSLNPNNTSKMGNVFFCTPHYKEEFLKKGKYEVTNEVPLEAADVSSYSAPRDVSSSTSNEMPPPVTHAEKFKKYKELMDQSSNSSSSGERKKPVSSSGNCSVKDMMKRYEISGNGDSTDATSSIVNNTSDRAELKHIRPNLSEMKRKFESQDTE